MKRRSHRNVLKSRGLVLLIVLGMLAMFSLLAVTYVVAASASRTGSRGILLDARKSNFSVDGTARQVMLQAIRGTSDIQSPFYMNDLLGDIWDRRPIETTFGSQFGSNGATSSVQLFTPTPITATTRTLPDVAFLKVTLSPQLGTANALSDFENEYNSRVLTILEGPLAGQSFRILKYVGYVRPGSATADLPQKPDPNTVATPWTTKLYSDSMANQIAYSVLIDLNEVKGELFSGPMVAGGKLRSTTLSLVNWINNFGVQSLFFKPKFNAADPYEGFAALINGAPFNSAGVGMEEVAYLGGNSVDGYGNVDSRRLFRIPTGINKFAPALLADYDYLQNPSIMEANSLDSGKVGVDGIGIPRNNLNEFRLNGGTNEGFDVPDYRDFWLAFKSYNSLNAPTPTIIPSYHRPAVIQHIAHRFGAANSLSPAQVTELLQLLDMSSARVMSYGGVNPGFMQAETNYPRLPANPTTAQLLDFVSKQIEGPWDVDNDGDGVPDSVWIDANLPVVYSPDGRRLRPLVAMLIEDLDGRVNVNVAGDRAQVSDNAFNAVGNGFKRSGQGVSNGFGYGPAEISLPSFFAPLGTPPSNFASISEVLKSVPNNFSIFDERYGARRSPFYRIRPINYSDPLLDRMPGVRNSNDGLSMLREREFHTALSHQRLPGISQMRRGSSGISFDLNGNPALVASSAVPESEISDDPYESATVGRPNADDPFALTELEAILRRYDQDAASLPDRLRQIFVRAGASNVNDFIYQQITTKSGELRHPNIAAAMRVGSSSNTGAVTVEHQAPSYLRYVQWLHTQRHRKEATDPEISYAALADLFPVDFASGLRMDLNRPFGDGKDNDNDGEIDEPSEVVLVENETLPDGSSHTGAYHRELKLSLVKPDNSTLNSRTRSRLGSRQVLARNLYCLAQLIIPDEYNFPGMESLNNTTDYWIRAQIRARSIAQWAVNVVDFRDADSVMTRFEYDISPFGIGSTHATPPIAAREAYWAPDHADKTVNGVSNRVYVGVVWGMEMPEAVLTENFAIHDRKVRDTRLDTGNSKFTDDTTDPDPDFDQYRYPEASLFLEVHVPRTTDIPTNAVGSGVPGLAGVSPSLYSENGGIVSLNLGKMAPASTSTVPGQNWASQPVWRIGISPDYGVAGANNANHPNVQLKAVGGVPTTIPPIGLTTHQQSFENLEAGSPARSGIANIASTNVTDVEHYLGNGLNYLVNDPSRVSAENGRLDGFERIVWFSSAQPTNTQNIPDILPAIRSNGLERQSVYRSTGGSAMVRGGGYLVVGPRAVTNIGSLRFKQFTAPNNVDYGASKTDHDTWGDANNRPQWSPSYQRIMLQSNAVNTYLISDRLANAAWVNNNIKQPVGLICTAPAPIDSGLPPGDPDWDVCFPDGVGLNISLPTPIHGDTHPLHTGGNYNTWSTAYRPTKRLNSGDTGPGVRPDGTPGFGTPQTPPDSYVDSANIGTGRFPDQPLDKRNPYVGRANRYRTGTYENVRVAYLQRLADPDLAYDPVSNPYITVDWMPIDLTVFNGEAEMGSETTDDPETAAQHNTSNNLVLQSRYKDGRLSPFSSNTSAPASGVSVYSPMTNDLKLNTAQAQPNPPNSSTGIRYQPYFPYQLGFDLPVTWPGADTDLDQASGTTLGYANVGYHKNNALVPVSGTDSSQFDGFGIPRSNMSDAFRGHTDHQQGLLWFNRPFATPYELTMVPATNPGNFGLYHSGFTGEQFNPFKFLPSFQALNAWSGVNGTPILHDKSYWAVPQQVGANYMADWPLLLEFVETQPPFIDADKWVNFGVNTTLLQNNGTGDAPLLSRFLNSYIGPNYYGLNDTETVRGSTLVTPFNRLPTFVTSGKVNLNTVSFDATGHSKALEAVEFPYMKGTNVAGAFNQARHGYDPGTVPQNNFLGRALTGFHPDYPTEFVGAFRPTLSANLAPPIGNPESNATDAQLTNNMRSRFGMQTSILRTANINANNSGTLDNSPLLFNSSNTDETNATQPFDKLQRAMRLPNLVTNQSNVFAVWVTVSLFEYDPLTEFGNEYLGSDGKPIRERKFFIIDRTVPVGYKPGETLNADRTILLESKL